MKLQNTTPACVRGSGRSTRRRGRASWRCRVCPWPTAWSGSRPSSTSTPWPGAGRRIPFPSGSRGRAATHRFHRATRRSPDATNQPADAPPERPRPQTPGHAPHESLERLDRHRRGGQVMMPEEHGGQRRPHEERRVEPARGVRASRGPPPPRDNPTSTPPVTSTRRTVIGTATHGSPSPQATTPRTPSPAAAITSRHRPGPHHPAIGRGPRAPADPGSPGCASGRTSEARLARRPTAGAAPPGRSARRMAKSASIGKVMRSSSILVTSGFARRKSAT